MESFEVVDEFDCSPDRLRSILETSPEFAGRLEEATQMRREVVESETTSDGGEYRRIRWVSLTEIPAMMQKAIGADRLEYEIEEESEADGGVTEWTLTTPFMTDRVEAGGTRRIEETDRGCRRSVEGRVDIQLPLVGAKMESKLVDKLRDAEEAAARIAAEMVTEEK